MRITAMPSARGPEAASAGKRNGAFKRSEHRRSVSEGAPCAQQRSGSVPHQQAPSVERGPERLCGGLRSRRASCLRHCNPPAREARPTERGGRRSAAERVASRRRLHLQRRPRSMPVSAFGRASSEGTRIGIKMPRSAAVGQSSGVAIARCGGSRFRCCLRAVAVA